MTRCQHCGQPIAPTRRIGVRYCDASCRSAARHARALNVAATERARERQEADEARLRGAYGPLGGRVVGYVPPPEWAWLATYYTSRRRSSGDAT